MWHPATCSCSYKSPIIIDVAGNGFKLTNSETGVKFQFDPNMQKIQTGWTVGGSDGDAFLVLDRNNNGIVDDGTELFGNFSPQPPSTNPNGYRALLEFDKPANGGNGDGVIDRSDAVFTNLRLWVDTNHDGISTAEELHSLPELGVNALGLQYVEVRREDQFGNVFRYRAAVNPGPQNQQPREGKWAYDVFFAHAPKAGSKSQSPTFVSTRRCRGTPREPGLRIDPAPVVNVR